MINFLDAAASENDSLVRYAVALLLPLAAVAAVTAVTAVTVAVAAAVAVGVSVEAVAITEAIITNIENN